MKRILLVAPFTLLPDEIGDNRFRYIAQLLATKHTVTFVTSNFNHPEKKFRNPKTAATELPYRLVLLAETGYQKNIGLARIRSHQVFAKNLKTFLKNQAGGFDFVYCAFPPITAAGICADFAKQQNIPFILDVQDVWPESILVYFKHFSNLARRALKPLSAKANKVYASADALVAISQTYLDRAALANKKATVKLPIYIGTNLAVFDKNVPAAPPFSAVGDELIGIYTGTLSHSYDVSTVIKAAAKLKVEGVKLKILILGHGPFAEKLKDEALALNAPVEFLGFKPFAEMCGYLAHAHFALHSITSASQSSLTNKFCDYCAAGLPVLNSSPNPELMAIVANNNLGINYPALDVDALCSAMQTLVKSSASRQQFGQNARAFAVKNLDRQLSYHPLFTLFE